MTTGTRPRNRKALIRVAAAELFRDRGYHNVAVADVAEAVGMTAPAMYRHYRNKQDLLADTVQFVLDSIEEEFTAADGLDDLLRRTAALTVQQHGLAAIWQRESRNLDADQRAAVLERSLSLMEQLRSHLRPVRPELTESDAVLLSVAIVGVFAMPSTPRTAVSQRRVEDLLYRAAWATARCELHSDGPVAFLPERAEEQREVAGVRTPRRDLLLNAAIRLFDERGFQSVGLGDIADASGIVRSGAYRYFDNKTEILVVAVTTAVDRMRRSASAALAQAEQPSDALDWIVDGHAEFAVENPRLLGIVVHDRAELPEDERRRFDRMMSDYDDIWLQALLQAFPDTDPAEGAAKIRLARVMIFFSVRWGPQPRRVDLEDRLAEVAMAILKA